ncbi:MAG: hypothetical protein HOP95_07365 [Sphingomonas sp.]|nr:hypothetical protein [Sphingomonas sp.]
MSDGPDWFAPKRYGFGSVPVTWQGWAITLGFVAIIVALAVALGRHPVQLIAALVPISAVFCVICARTTRGGWRWRWGEEED